MAAKLHRLISFDIGNVASAGSAQAGPSEAAGAGAAEHGYDVLVGTGAPSSALWQNGCAGISQVLHPKPKRVCRAPSKWASITHPHVPEHSIALPACHALCAVAAALRCLQVRIVQAHGLAAADWWSRSSDPYCVLRLQAPGGEDVVQYKCVRLPRLAAKGGRFAAQECAGAAVRCHAHCLPSVPGARGAPPVGTPGGQAAREADCPCTALRCELLGAPPRAGRELSSRTSTRSMTSSSRWETCRRALSWRQRYGDGLGV